MTPSFIRWARRHLNRFLAHREAQQRQKRREAMFRADPVLMTAYDRWQQKQRHHDTTAAELAEMQQRVNDMLRRSVSHG